jgi:tRNA (mo5U34)-methyltransferase
MGVISDRGETLEDQIAAIDWYHTIELRPGVTTPGEYDLRPVVDRLPLASSVEGKRVLDVGTHDGFWAFEMERLGAQSVVALDVDRPESFDWPWFSSPDYGWALIERRRRAFALAGSCRSSRVEPCEMSVYDLAVDRIEPFDFAIVGTLLLHLRDPVGALAAIRRVASKILVNDVVSLSLTLRQPRGSTARLIAPPGRPFWWVPSVRTLRHYVGAAGWSVIATGGPYLVPYGAGHRRRPLLGRLRHGSGLVDELLGLRGAPHAWVLAAAAGP